jgi:hypothetical protein
LGQVLLFAWLDGDTTILARNSVVPTFHFHWRIGTISTARSMRQPALNQGPGESDESRTESMVAAAIQCRIMRKIDNENPGK